MIGFIMTEALTGHMYYMSPYETFDSCGNCDGAKCEYCKTMYMVEDFTGQNIIPSGYKLFKTKEEGEEYMTKLEKEHNIACDF